MELFNDGLTFRNIGRLMHRSHVTVANTIKRFKETGNNSSRMGRGRLETLSIADHHYIKLLSLRDRRKTVPHITSEFNISRNTPVSASTIRRSLQQSGLNGRVAAKKPLLRPQNGMKRLKFAREHLDWARVFFTDESKFQLFGTNRRVFVR